MMRYRNIETGVLLCPTLPEVEKHLKRDPRYIEEPAEEIPATKDEPDVVEAPRRRGRKPPASGSEE